jgi:hypothetical protein
MRCPSACAISAPDIGTTTTADVGLYKSTRDGGAVVDADFFKAAVVLNAGAIAKSEVVNGNVITLANSEKGDMGFARPFERPQPAV